MALQTSEFSTEPLNMSGNVQVKEETSELTLEIKPESEETLDETQFEDMQVNVKHEFRVNSERESDPIESDFVDEDTNIKMEEPYEYTCVDDGSMDSEEATALNNVEACLQEDADVKTEIYEDHPKQHIKEEMDITVTDTHLISNKVINTTSTITNPQDGLVQSQITKTLVMEIHPMVDINVPLGRMGNTEEILPTCNNYEEYDSFQLNSITGNVLSLEQEAYGLLKEESSIDNKVFCPKCDKGFKKTSYLKNHLKVHASIEARAMGVIKGLKTRMENLKKKVYKDIKNDFKDIADININLKSRLERLENRRKIKENGVKKESVVKAKEIKVPVVKKEGYECTCGIIYRRRIRMESCLRSHEEYKNMDSFPCVSCTKHFNNKQDLMLHRKRIHRKRFPCKFCPTDYSTRKELFKHLQIHQKVQLMEYKVISEVVKGKQKIKCFMCLKSFSEISELKSHVMDDHKEPYICPHCNGKFVKIIDFGNHTKMYHPEVEGQSVLDVLEAFSKLVQAWKCEECNLQFNEADKFAKHQVEKHSPDLKAKEQFQCTDCRRVFISQKGLTSHKRIHHNTETAEVAEPEETGLMCVECRKICKDENTLTAHMRLHSMDRKYPCKFCDFRFATPEKRKAHSELHTGDMKYVCFICEYQCSSENRLELHKMSLKHLNMKEFLLTGKPLIEEPEPKKSEEREKKRKKSSSSTVEDTCSICDICGEKFSSKDEMLIHKQTHPFIEFPNEDTPTRIFFK